MLERCPIEESTRRYYEAIEKAEKAQEEFIALIEPHLFEIAEQACKIKEIEAKYESYDFENLIKEMIEEVL